MSGRSQWAISCKDKLLSKWSTLLTVLFARASMCRSKTSNCHAQHGWWNKSLAIKCMQNVWMNAYMYEWLNVWMSGCLNVWMFECSSVWLFECLHVWMFECLDVWMFGCSNVWTFECLSVWWFECLNTSEYVWIRLNTFDFFAFLTKHMGTFQHLCDDDKQNFEGSVAILAQAVIWASNQMTSPLPHLTFETVWNHVECWMCTVWCDKSSCWGDMLRRYWAIGNQIHVKTPTECCLECFNVGTLLFLSTVRLPQNLGVAFERYHAGRDFSQNFLILAGA